MNNPKGSQEDVRKENNLPSRAGEEVKAQGEEERGGCGSMSKELEDVDNNIDLAVCSSKEECTFQLFCYLSFCHRLC